MKNIYRCVHCEFIAPKKQRFCIQCGAENTAVKLKYFQLYRLLLSLITTSRLDMLDFLALQAGWENETNDTISKALCDQLDLMWKESQ